MIEIMLKRWYLEALLVLTTAAWIAPSGVCHAAGVIFLPVQARRPGDAIVDQPVQPVVQRAESEARPET